MALKDHLNKIEYFQKIVELGSLQRASKEAKISQPQLSRTVGLLEKELGKKLLIRSVKGVSPTFEGLKLYEFSKSLLLDAAKVESVIKSNKRIKGEINIGAYDSIGVYFFTPFLQYQKNLNPQLTINLMMDRSAELIRKVAEGEIDLCLATRWSGDITGLESEEIYSDSFQLYRSSGLCNEGETTLIFFPGSIGLDAKEANLFCERYRFKNTIIAQNMETVRAMTERGAGVGLLPKLVAKDLVVCGKLISSEKLLLSSHSHKIFVFWKKKNDKVNEFFLQELKYFLRHWSHHD